VTPAQLISRKRDGQELSDEEIAEFIRQYARGDLPDYQMSAFAMAVYFQGMSSRETSALTHAMLRSGITLTWSDSATAKVDKHSTGGIGDKISLVLAPVLACCGLQVPMLSGRGLGITGGTLDKLESIRGYRTDLTIREIQAQTEAVGCVITGASSELAPADKRLYALRDVTGTVPSIPLITASIMSKKLAEKLDALVLDVKFGSGAFMKTIEQAEQLARSLVDVGRAMGVRTSALITDMNQPLGRFVGNALEVREALDVLSGNGPDDVLELTLALGSELLVGEGRVHDRVSGRAVQQRVIDSGAGLEKFWEMAEAQGAARESSVESVSSTDVLAERSGVVAVIDNAALGEAVIRLGGGRRVMTDEIDHAVGLEVLVRVGNPVARGQPMLRVFSRRSHESHSELAHAFFIEEGPVAPLTLIQKSIVE
jgi:pyrimidine-nucleoside phosphorylase